MLSLAGPLSCLRDRALEEGLKGGRCHPSVSDYHITAVLGLAGSGWAAKLLERSGSGGAFEGGKDCAEFGWAAKLLERSGPGGGFEGGKVPSVSFGLPYNCCAGSGWVWLGR